MIVSKPSLAHHSTFHRGRCAPPLWPVFDPIVFPVAGDPVAGGIVENLARPGGNATGFAQFEFSLSGKWLELLKEITPALTQVAVLRDPTVGTGTSQFAVMQAVAPAAVQPTPRMPPSVPIPHNRRF